jgi:hypothetical protein
MDSVHILHPICHVITYIFSTRRKIFSFIEPNIFDHTWKFPHGFDDRRMVDFLNELEIVLEKIYKFRPWVQQMQSFVQIPSNMQISMIGNDMKVEDCSMHECLHDIYGVFFKCSLFVISFLTHDMTSMTGVILVLESINQDVNWHVMGQALEHELYGVDDFNE